MPGMSRSQTDTLGRDDATPVAQADLPPRVAVAEYSLPAILRVKTAANIAQAKALGFNFVLLPGLEYLVDAERTGLGILLEIDLTYPDAGTLRELANGPGLALHELPEHDVTVAWWDVKLATCQQAGIAEFYARNAHVLAPSIWERLLIALRERDAKALCIAEIFGATPAQITALTGAGFDYATSSSCWWDFSAGWLNGDSARLASIAPALAHAAPPDTTGWSKAATLRALRFSAAFAPGWLVEAGLITQPGLDLADDIRALNALRREHPALRTPLPAQLRSSPGGAVALLTRERLIIAVNPALDQQAGLPASAAMPVLGTTLLAALGEIALPLTPTGAIRLEPGETRFFEAAIPEPILLPPPSLDCDAPRIAIEAITPQVDDGSFPVRRTLGDLVTIAADLLGDGHDKLAGDVLLRAVDSADFRAFPLTLLNNDRWTANIPLERLGRHVFAVTAWRDSYGSFVDEVTKKHAAGIATSLELREGLALVEEAARTNSKLQLVLERLRNAPDETLRETLLSERVIAVMRHAAPRNFLARSHDILIDAERRAAGFASWYEIFPRSPERRSGSARHVPRRRSASCRASAPWVSTCSISRRSTRSARINRKGRNNALTAGAGRSRQPLCDRQRGGRPRRDPSRARHARGFPRICVTPPPHTGMEIALDFADPMRARPSLADASIRTGSTGGPTARSATPRTRRRNTRTSSMSISTPMPMPALWLALRDVVLFWCEQGVRIFRVDNPHTKPLPFWEWLIADIRATLSRRRSSSPRPSPGRR